MTATLEIKVWVKGGQYTRNPDYYIEIDDSEYAPLLRELVEAFVKIARAVEKGRVPELV